MKFKKGDRVICVSINGLRTALVVGNQYIIAEDPYIGFNDDEYVNVWLEGICYSAFYVTRFKKALILNKQIQIL